jgi:hypothetical protein
MEMNQVVLHLIDGLIGAVIASAVAMFIYSRGLKRRKLAYSILSRVSLVHVSRRVKGEIGITFNGEPVENVYAFKIRLENTGSEPLENQPVLFEFDESTDVLDVSWSTEPQKEFGDIVEDPTVSETWRKRFTFALLNPGDSAVADFLTMNNRTQEVEIAARAKGLAFYRADRKSLRSRFGGSVVMILGLLLLVIGHIMDPNMRTVAKAMAQTWPSTIWGWVLIPVGFLLVFGVIIGISFRTISQLLRLTNRKQKHWS